jgi:hypothetical protein
LDTPIAEVVFRIKRPAIWSSWEKLAALLAGKRKTEKVSALTQKQIREFAGVASGAPGRHSKFFIQNFCQERQKKKSVP